MALINPQQLMGMFNFGSPASGSGIMPGGANTSGTGWLDKLGQFAGSPGGSSLINAALGGIAGMGQNAREDRMLNESRAFNNQQLMAQLGLRQQQSILDDTFNRDALLTQAAPTGWDQNYQQQTLLKNMMMQKLMAGSSLTPTNEAVAAKLASLGGGFKPTIPEEWQSVNPFGVQQTMQSLAQRQGILDLLSGGRAPGLDFTQKGLQGDMGQRLNQQTGAYRQFAANDMQQRNAGGGQGFLPTGGGLTAGMNMGGPTGKQSALGNLTSGALGGAQLGSMFGPIGTGIGAGIGAAVGGLKSLFSGGEGKQTNNVRDDFVNRFGTMYGGPNNREYSGYTGAMGELGAQLNDAGRPDLFQQFAKSGNRTELQRIMEAINGLVGRNNPGGYAGTPGITGNPYIRYSFGAK